MDTVKLNLEDLLECINGDFKLNPDPPVKRNPKNPDNLVKVEFNNFVKEENFKRRQNSTVIALRDFHNYIKETLLVNIVKVYRSEHPKEKHISLLDIAVGRGGDMFKWTKAGIKSVFGFDKSKDSIESINPFNQGARERYSKVKIPVDIVYTVGDATQPTPELLAEIEAFQEKRKFKQFQILSCQFAMHYFFKNQEALETVFATISPLIKKGGYFVGTTIDGSKITGFLGKNNSFQSNLLGLTKKYKAVTPKLPFGNGYTFRLNDSFDGANYFNTLGESLEYLVNMETLNQTAIKFGFQPVFINLFQKRDNRYLQIRTVGDLKPKFLSFGEIYSFPEHGKQLSPEEILINSLYTTFIFKKL